MSKEKKRSWYIKLWSRSKIKFFLFAILLIVLTSIPVNYTMIMRTVMPTAVLHRLNIPIAHPVVELNRNAPIQNKGHLYNQKLYHAERHKTVSTSSSPVHMAARKSTLSNQKAGSSHVAVRKSTLSNQKAGSSHMAMRKSTLSNQKAGSSHVASRESTLSNEKTVTSSHVAARKSTSPNQKAGSSHVAAAKGAKSTSTTQQSQKTKFNEGLFKDILHWNGSPLKRGYPQWQRLDNNFGAFLYGAHFNDVDFPPVIRVVGIARSILLYENVTCYFYDGHDGPRGRNVSGRLYHFRRRNGFDYIGAFVDCPIPISDRSYLPFALSVSRENDTEITNYMIVHYSYNVTYFRQHGYIWPANAVSTEKWKNATEDKKSRNSSSSEKHHQHKHHHQQQQQQQQQKYLTSPWKWNLTRCFPAIQSSYNNYQFLAEMVSVNIALGVQHFVFYVKHAGSGVLRLLQVLEKRGLAEVHPWNLALPGSRKGGVFYSAQFSSIQDCLYRHLSTSRYLLFGDMDEVFVPRTRPTLLPLLVEQFDRVECV